MVDLIKARLDVSLKDPLVVTTRCAKEVYLSYCILGSALGAKAIRTRLKVRLKDRLKHQFQGRLHYPVTSSWYPQTTDFACRLRDYLLSPVDDHQKSRSAINRIRVHDLIR